jgi:rhodanese-related sulfurtransferase
MGNQTLVKEICPTTTQEWVKNGALLIDVREKHEVEELAYDVPNIINIPLSEFEERYTEIPSIKDIVVVCQSGNRSLRAAGFLINHGYTNVVNMQYGMTRWVQKGFPTKGDRASVTDFLARGCCTPTTEKKKVNMSDLGENCDCSEPGCC